MPSLLQKGFHKQRPDGITYFHLLRKLLLPVFISMQTYKSQKTKKIDVARQSNYNYDRVYARWGF